MNGKKLEEQRQLYNIYCGIIFNAKDFKGGDGQVNYDFDCPEYAELLQKYPIRRAAGRGGDFQRALRLCRWLHPRLRHDGYYDNHVECNSLALLDYCFERPDRGINCLNKAKILTECCLALGIYARRVFMMPYSPYDLDNHVVTEIYDRAEKMWIMLDPSMGTYIVDGQGTPLSLMQARTAAGEGKLITAVASGQSLKDINALAERNLAAGYNAYYAKNMAYFIADAANKFGDCGETLYLLPQHYNLKDNRLCNTRFRIDTLKRMGKTELAARLEANESENVQEEARISVAAFAATPV